MRSKNVFEGLGCLVAAALALGVTGCSYRASVATTTDTRSMQASTYASGPDNAYVRYEQTLVNAASVEEVMPFMPDANRARIAQWTAQQKATYLEQLKMSAATQLNVAHVQTSGDRATLDVQGVQVRPIAGTTGQGRATVQMMREAGLWRVVEERWEIAAPAPAPLPSRPPATNTMPSDTPQSAAPQGARESSPESPGAAGSVEQPGTPPSKESLAPPLPADTGAVYGVPPPPPVPKRSAAPPAPTP